MVSTGRRSWDVAVWPWSLRRRCGTAGSMAVEPASEARPKRDSRALVRKLDWRATPERSGQEEHDRFEAAVQRVIDAPAGTSDKTQRQELFHLFLRLVAELEASIAKSAEKRRQWRTWSRG